MHEVKLNIGDYNRLYMVATSDDSYILAKMKENYIVLTDLGDDAIAHIELNTREGKILSHYTYCLLRAIEKDGNISLHNVCLGDWTSWDCNNCQVKSNSQYICKLGIMEQLESLNEKVEDIQFVDPIPNRSYKMVERLEKCSDMIYDMKRCLDNNPDADIQAIYDTIGILEKQLDDLLDKWDYEKEIG